MPTPWSTSLFTRMESILVLCCYITIISKLSDLNSKKMFVIAHICVSGTQEWFTCVVLTQGCLWGYGQGFGRGCHHMKTYVGLDDPFPQRPTHTAGELVLPLDIMSLYPDTWTLEWLHNVVVGCPQNMWSKKTRQKPQCLLRLSLISHL